MAISYAQAGIFAAGALAGALVAGWAVYDNADRLHAIAHPQRTAASPIAQDTPCPGAVTLSATKDDDASFKLLDATADHKPADVTSFITIGKEAAASGRVRDAEIAFVMACRVAARTNTDPVLLADAKYQLARHFSNVASESAPATREDLVRRARALYTDSLRIYAARLGREHEKTTFASNALAALDIPAALGAPADATVAAVSPPVASPPVEGPPSTAPSRGNDTRYDTRYLGAGPAPVATPPAKPSARASFDCSKARSRTERMICGDPQLAQMDRELAGLYAQAKAGASNAADFRRRSDAEWKRREQTCRDRECLVSWYAKRRGQLQAEIDAQRSRRTAANR